MEGEIFYVFSDWSVKSVCRGFEFGTASLPTYDGTSFARNQDVVFVSFNYRTNVFGFPTSQEFSAPNNNLGLLDQELALAWVQDNIAQFGGDKNKVTLMVRMVSRDACHHIIAEFGIAGPFCRVLVRLNGHHPVEAGCRCRSTISCWHHAIRRASFYIPGA